MTGDDESKAQAELEALLDARMKRARTEGFSTRTAEEIFDEGIKAANNERKAETLRRTIDEIRQRNADLTAEAANEAVEEARAPRRDGET